MIDRDQAEELIRTCAATMRRRGYKPTEVVVSPPLMRTLGEPVFLDGMRVVTSLEMEDGKLLVR
jgi:hypothetical protein